MTEATTQERGAARIASALCYLFGPVSGFFFLFRDNWAVRFHAAHSLLMSAVFLAGWLVLSTAKVLSPWFLSAQFREFLWAGMVGSIPVWLFAMLSAYRGDRFVPIPVVHELAVKLARRVEHSRSASSDWSRPPR